MDAVTRPFAMTWPRRGGGHPPLPHSTRVVRACTRRGFVATVTRIARASRRTQLFLMMDARSAARPTVTAALDQRREWRRWRGEHAVTIDCPCRLASVTDDRARNQSA